jgi:tyrosine-protein kinase Etk/Wzc
MQVMVSRGVATDAVNRGGLRLAPANGQWRPDEIVAVSVAPNAPTDSLHLRFGASEVTAQSGRDIAKASYGQPLEIRGVTLTVASRPKVSSADFTVLSQPAAVAGLLGSFKVIARPKTDIIDLSFVGSDPHFARLAVNAMAETFQERNATTAQQASRRRRIFLEQQMRQTDSMLQKAMNDYSSFRSTRRVFSSREKASAQEQGMISLDMRRADLDAQRRTYAALLGQAQRNREASDPNLRALVSSPGIAANPVVQALYSQLTEYEAALDSMVTSGAAPTNPDLVAVKTRLSTANSRLIAAVRNQVSALDATIASLDQLKARSVTEIASAPATETEEAQLGQQVQAIQKIADQLQEEYQKARMSEAVEVGQVEIVDLADVPNFPIGSGRIRKTAMGLILGLMLGIGAAVLIDGMNTSIRRRDDLERLLQVPGLAVIPRFVSENRKGGKLVKAFPRMKTGRAAASQRAEGLVTIHDARSPGAEAYRTLRTNLIFSQAVHMLRTIVVTSPSPSEGKTTTAANLAVSFAQQGMRVLIVDCDLRRSRLHRMFSVSREPGITELVLGQVEQEIAIRDTPVSGLYVLPSGQLPPNPAELLGGERMRNTLRKLGEAFDLILLDTPPLLAASDAAILATQVDGVVVVVRAGVTEAEAGQQAMQQLAAVGARVVGAVLNDPDSKLQQYGGYYNYEYASEGADAKG